jgi:O-antigen/teichoic acid export membrane protein
MNTARAVLFKAFADAAARSAGLITFPVIARHVGASGYGGYAQVGVVMSIVVPLAALGLGTVMVRYFSSPAWTPPLARKALMIGAIVGGLGLVSTVLVFVLAKPLNDAFLGYHDGAELFRWGSLLVVTGALETWVLDVLRARYWLIQFSVFQLGQSLLVVVATVLLLTHGHGLVALIQATAAIKAAFILAGVAGIASRARPGASDSAPAIPGFGALVRFGLPLAISGFGIWLVQLSDRLVVGNVLGAAAVGRYGIVYNIGALTAAAAAPLMLPAYPRIVRAAAVENHEAVTADVQLFHRYLVLTVVPIAVWLAVIVPTLVRVLGGAGFHVAWPIGALVIGGLFLDQWNGLAHYVLIAYNRTLLSQNVWLAGGFLNVGLCVVLVPPFGLEGAAVATLLCFVFIEGIMFVAAMRYVDLLRTYRYDTTLRAGSAALVAGAAAGAIIALMPTTAAAAVAATVVFFGVFIALAFAIGEIGASEVGLLRSALRRRALA